MMVVDQITGKIGKLPLPLQAEVLDFIDFLLYKTKNEEREWSDFSLKQAMIGLEKDDDLPEYSDADLKEKWL